MSNQTEYINGVFANEVTFRDGGSIIKLSIPADKLADLFAQLEYNIDDGWIRLKLSKMRENRVNASGKVIATHSLSVDTWKPNASGQRQATPRPQSSPSAPPANQPENSNDVPF